MTIREKIDKPALDLEKNRDVIILKGGKVSADELHKKKEWTNFCLRIRMDLFHEIDEFLEKRVGLSKTAWILEAIQEKIKSSKNER